MGEEGQLPAGLPELPSMASTREATADLLAAHQSGGRERTSFEKRSEEGKADTYCMVETLMEVGVCVCVCVCVLV